MSATAARKLLKEGVSICKRRGALLTAEKKLMEALALDPSVTAEAYLALAEGAQLRICDRAIIVGYRDKAIEHLQKLARATKNDPAVLLSLARAFQLPPTKASYARSVKMLDRVLLVEPSPEVHAEKAKALEAIHWLTFGGWTLGFPSSAVRHAKDRKMSKQMLAMWTQIALSYEEAGPRFKTDASKWRRWLRRL